MLRQLLNKTSRNHPDGAIACFNVLAEAELCTRRDFPRSGDAERIGGCRNGGMPGMVTVLVTMGFQGLGPVTAPGCLRGIPAQPQHQGRQLDQQHNHEAVGIAALGSIRQA
jgi:hypothetical protein